VVKVLGGIELLHERIGDDRKVWLQYVGIINGVTFNGCTSDLLGIVSENTYPMNHMKEKFQTDICE